MQRGPIALALGIMAGFLTLAALYFGFVRHDLALVAVFAALASSQLALLPVATRKPDCGGGEG
jgi:hypothetical protein